MARTGSTQLSFPSFKGVTRWLVLVNLASFFFFLLASDASLTPVMRLMGRMLLFPYDFIHGSVWQPLTYSFMHPPSQVVAALFELLSIWFLAGFLETIHGTKWVTGLYAVSVLATALAGVVIYLASNVFDFTLLPLPIYGCNGAVFGLMVAIATLYGDMEFTLIPLPFTMKAKIMALIYLLVALAILFGEQRILAFSQLGGALGGYLWARFASARGPSFRFGFTLSERWYGLRNGYYRWKRRRAARKFEVYMKSQGRTVKFDGQGHQIDDDPNDKKRWN